MKAIVAVDKNWGIGKDNEMLISIPDDMKFFVDQTKGKVVLMGRNTLESLPGGRPLKHRKNIVVSKSMEERDNVVVVRSVEEALEEVSKYPPDEIMIIGGDSVYRQFLDYCEECIVTKIDKEFPGVQAFFPNLDEKKDWKLCNETEKCSWEGIEYSFNWYKNLKVKEV
ncbi:dihydrofolate reductase [Lagierella sp.]|uniref:dihydrofolate reductase n=1 Tax=Lagierella sp. TaxID=2849657 RepID=UPI00261A7946|nr:dihydrofolate reductase [Lagierella sp.]